MPRCRPRAHMPTRTAPPPSALPSPVSARRGEERQERPGRTAPAPQGRGSARTLCAAAAAAWGRRWSLPPAPQVGAADRRAGKREGSAPQTYSLHPRPPLPHCRSPRQASCGKPPSLSAGPSHPPERAVAWAAAHRRWVLGRATLGGSGPSSARFPAGWDVPGALSGLLAPPPCFPPCRSAATAVTSSGGTQGEGSSGASGCLL